MTNGSSGRLLGTAVNLAVIGLTIGVLRKTLSPKQRRKRVVRRRRKR